MLIAENLGIFIETLAQSFDIQFEQCAAALLPACLKRARRGLSSSALDGLDKVPGV